MSARVNTASAHRFPLLLAALLLAGCLPVLAADPEDGLRTSALATEAPGEANPAGAAPPMEIPLPDVAEPPVTGDGRGLEPTITIILPPPPDPAEITLMLQPAIAVATPPEPPFPTIDAPDAGVLVQATVERQLGRLVGNGLLGRAESADVLEFYNRRDFRPAWTHALGWTARGGKVREALAAADRDGLDPARYRTVSGFHGGMEALAPAIALADVELSVAVVRYARDLRNGRVPPRRIHPLVTPRLDPPDTAGLLSDLSAADDPAALLARQAPPHAGYLALRRRLAEVRAQARETATVRVPAGPTLRAGMRDPRVPLIRLAAGLPAGTDDVYSRELAGEIARLQRQAGLPASGHFTDQTGRALGTGTGEEGEIIANMELWRLVPRELGENHIFVNAPSFRMEVVSGGEVAFSARTIVGKDDTQTPFFSDEMDHIVINPSWYVPPGILKRDKRYLDPAWTAARGYEMRRKGNIVTVRVPPGGANALGAVKFMFPNDHAVYLHDTNARGLFGNANRALSNGCVRVENPMRLAAWLFADQGWTEERFQRLVGQGERPMRLREKLPIHLVYLTLTPGPAGTLERHPDIYGHVGRLRQLLAGG